ncbi:MAG TPA: VOC family protein [Acidimicrobiia bacterium]|jgi:PhnB protein
MAAVKPIPDNSPRLTAYLAIDGAAEAIDFYTRVLGAHERMRMSEPGGKVGHAELEFGESVVMLSDAFPEMGVVDPRRLGGSPVTLSVYVENVDATFRDAIAAGAKELQPVEDKFYGDRAGQFEDPWGHRWNVMSHIEDLSDEEVERRAAAYMANEG